MKRTLSCLLITAIITSGCSVLNPYKSEFNCPQKENGKCVGVENAYDESLKTMKDGKENPEKSGNKVPEKVPGGGSAKGGELLYQEEVYRKLAGLLREPVTPLVSPPRVMRVLLLPYRGEGGELFMPRYVYFMAEDSRWIMGGYLREGAAD